MSINIIHDLNIESHVEKVSALMVIKYYRGNRSGKMFGQSFYVSSYYYYYYLRETSVDQQK